MELQDKIFIYFKKECKLSDEAQIRDYMNKRQKQILDNHYHNVCRLYLPGEGGTKYYSTKLTPKDRTKQNKIYSTTLEGLEDKIIAYYLKIEADSKITVRSILLKAVDADSKTGKRTLQRFDKHLSCLAKIPIASLSEEHIKNALASIIAKNVKAKEFNETVGALNKIADYCRYEHIDIIDIRLIISTFRRVKLTGKHIFKDTSKQSRNLAFTRTEVSRIVRDAVNYPSYKSLAVATLVLTGLRVGELLGLTLDDVYLDDDYLWIHTMEDTKSFEILDYIKENRSREVYLSDEAKMIIQLAINFRVSDNTISPYLFLNANARDGKMHLRAIDDYMRRHIHRDVLGYGAEREARSPHDCRRTYASLEYLNGTDIYTLKNQLGHTKITQTEEYIKDIIESSERKSRLKGTGILYELPNRLTVDSYLDNKKVQ